MIAAADALVGLGIAHAGGESVTERYAPARVRAAVRNALVAGGLGRLDPDIPLADLIAPGMSVLLKPNWVLHFNTSGQGMDCMVTHGAVIEAVVEEVLLARPARVIIGDAPIQACRLDLLVPESWRERLRQQSGGVVEFRDFRRTIASDHDLSRGVDREARALDSYVLFDLAEHSLLEPVSGSGRGFRVTNYDPDVLGRTHRAGRHQYLICREALEADVVINLPKLKTHKKAGMTGALKNLVGINGSKEYLPHHRAGGTGRGGDCYPGSAPLNALAESCLDRANRRINEGLSYRAWNRVATALHRLQNTIGDADLEGGWHGNDTTWRMVLDINRVFLYGRLNGTIAEEPQRAVYSITDAIVAGQGEGPLGPDALPLGIVTCARTSAYADLVHAALLGFDAGRLPMVWQAFTSFTYPLARTAPDCCVVAAQGERLSPTAAAVRFGAHARPPARWRGHVELEALQPC